MDWFKRYMRTMPAAFWLALLGVVFSLVVFLSGLFMEESGFALIFMVPGYLTVAILTAFSQRSLRAVAAGISVLMALVFAFFAILFATSPDQAAPGQAPTLVAVHATAMMIAGAAAVSDFRACLRTVRPRKAASG